jgi:hypothetical protein
MSLFGGKPQQADPATVAAQQQAAGANTTVPSQATPVSNGSNVAIPAVGQGEASPLAGFADLWKTDPNTPPPTTSIVPNFNMDPAGLMKMAQQVNFTNHIPQETITKALSGDQTAFLDVINQAAQLGYANATAASSEIIKNSLGKAQGVLQESVLPNAFRNQQIDQALTASNPIFTDPAVAPMLGMLKNQLQQKYPTATPEQIAEQASAYLGAMSNRIVTAQGGTIMPKGQQSKSGFGQQQEQDWSIFFNA